MKSDVKKYIAILENLCVEPESGKEARLDADELDAVLYAINVLKSNREDSYGKFCGKCKYKNGNIGRPKEGVFWCDKHHYMTGHYSCCTDFDAGEN